MRIFCIEDFTNGCAEVRSRLPLAYLAKKGHDFSWYRGEDGGFDPSEWDMVLSGRVVGGDVEAGFTMMKRHGLKIVYDIDDALELVEASNPAFVVTVASVNRYLFMLRNSDLVTTTNPKLAHHLRQFVPHETPIAVLPNCIDPEAWRTRAGGNARPRIGFAGSNSHMRDLYPVLEAVKDLQDEGLTFDFVVFGMSHTHENVEDWAADNRKVLEKYPDTLFGDALEGFRTRLQAISHEWATSVAPQAYPARLAALNLDLGICAVRDSDFNRFKSCVKAYEYAMVGTEVMCSDNDPYRSELTGLVPLIEHTREGWKIALRRYLLKTGPEGYTDVRRLNEWVLRERNIETSGALWEEAYNGLFKK